MRNRENKIATYTRVSTVEQNIERQEQNLVGKLYRDKISGRTKFTSRPKGKELLNDVANGEINHIIFHTIDRAGRNILDIQNTLNELVRVKCQVEIKDLNIKLLDDDGELNLISKMIIDLLSNLANIDINNSKERQKEGITLAKVKGIYKGGKIGRKMDIEKRLDKYPNVVILYKEGVSVRRCSKILSKPHQTISNLYSLLDNKYNR